jgi:hypothetical protein
MRLTVLCQHKQHLHRLIDNIDVRIEMGNIRKQMIILKRRS